jgi:hypothetical protein
MANALKMEAIEKIDYVASFEDDNIKLQATK